MKKLFIRLSVVTLAAILSLCMLSVSAATGSDDGIVSFSSVRGDINGDGDIDVRDLVRLKKYTAEIGGIKIVEYNSDLNGDGKYNAEDLSELRIMLLNM